MITIAFLCYFQEKKKKKQKQKETEEFQVQDNTYFPHVSSGETDKTTSTGKVILM